MRLVEIVGSLALATESAAGVAPETASRAALIGIDLAESLGMNADVRRQIFYASLLRYIGCSSFAHEMAHFGSGDDLALMRALTPMDGGNPRSVMRTVFANAGKGSGPVGRVATVARVLADPTAPQRLAAAHCEQAVHLASKLGAGDGVVAILGQTYERFDGKGGPGALAGEAISAAARVMHAAYIFVLHASFAGVDAGFEVVRERRGGELDPAMCDALSARQEHARAIVAAPSVWDRLRDAEPVPRKYVGFDRIADVAHAFALFVDLKSPFTIGHSVGVGELTAKALSEMGAPPAECERGRIAGFLHDLGRASVPNGIWDKPARLNALERERVEQHAHQSERILARTALFEGLARAVGSHHERLDGRGYPRGLSGGSLDRLARVLAAADVYRALREDRAYRPRRTPEGAATEINVEVKASRLDVDAVEAVLAAAGHARNSRTTKAAPCGLSDREVEVLVLLARGMTNKQIGKRLYISPRTVGHHVAHIYEKAKVKTRAAAALFAAEHDLVTALD